MSADRPHRRAVLGGLCAGLLAGGARAQGFAGQGFANLGAAADGFAEPRRGRALVFPDDLGAHPEFRTQWWYVTANLRDAAGDPLGVQWTLFRHGLAPGSAEGWADPAVWMGHAAVTTAREHRFAERLGRGGIGQAGAQAAPFRAFIDNWALAEDTPGRWAMNAAGSDFAFRLSLSLDGPFVAQGDAGYSVKSERGQASHYFSQPFMGARGTVVLDGAEMAVSGRAWLDREWSSQVLSPDQEGWDWVSLHLEGGAKLMAFRLRGAEGDFYSGTWIAPDGTAAPLPGSGIEMTPGGVRRVAGRRIPTRWRLRVPSRGLDLRIAPLNPEAWNPGTVPYWEGPVVAEGSHAAEGYLELTGY